MSGIPAGWSRRGATAITRGSFKIAWCHVGEDLRFLVSRDGSDRVEYRDDIKAAVAVADEWAGERPAGG